MKIVFLSIISGAAIIAGQARGEDTVTLSQTPAAVQKIIQAQAGDGQMGDITKSIEDEESVFDVDLTAKDGTDRDFTVAQDGTLLSTEVTLAETPDAAQKTIKTELAGGSLDSIDKNLADSEVSYDVEGVAKDGKTNDFTVAEDGTILSQEVALNDTPDAVQKAIAAKLNGGRVDSIDENFDDDGTNFDVTLTGQSGPVKSFNVSDDGTVTSEQIPQADVSGRAKATIMSQIGDGTVLRVDKSLTKERGVFPYDVEGRKDGKPFDFSVGPRGKFMGMSD